MLRIGEGLVASVKALVFLNWVINAYIFIFIGIFLLSQILFITFINILSYEIIKLI